MSKSEIEGTKPKVIPEMRGVADLSTSHVTREDAELLNAGDVPGQIGNHEYGWVVATHYHDRAEELLQHGMSQSYVGLLKLLHKRGFWYAFFDRDADQVAGLPHYDW